MALRSLQSAPQFFQEEYHTGERFTWCFAGFDCLRSSFYPEGRRTPQAINSLCGSSLAFLWCIYVLQDTGILTTHWFCQKTFLTFVGIQEGWPSLVSISVGEGELVSCILPAGFVLLEEDIQLEAEDVLALIPPRAHVPQQLSVVACFEERLMFLGGFGLVASSCVKYYAFPPCWMALNDSDSIERISQWHSPTNDQLSWAAACASFWSSSTSSTGRVARRSCSISSCTPSRSMLWLVGTPWRCLWLGLGRQTVSESLSPWVHSPAVLCSI